jgi:hypothetical protein
MLDSAAAWQKNKEEQNGDGEEFYANPCFRKSTQQTEQTLMCVMATSFHTYTQYGGVEAYTLLTDATGTTIVLKQHNPKGAVSPSATHSQRIPTGIPHAHNNMHQARLSRS